MESLKSELRYILRGFARAPMFAVVAVITIAIGIGANTAIFSVIEGVLLKPLPYPDPGRLVGVWQTAPGIGIADLNASPATYFTYREQNRSFTDIGMWQGDSVSVTGIAEPEQVDAVDVTDGLLPVLGVQPVLGRWFTHKDDSPDAPQTVMLTYSYWQRRFGGDRSVLGRRLMIDGKAREVIGIMPRDFRFMDRKPALLLPLQLDESKTFIGNFSYQAVARLKPGISIRQANGDIARMLPMMSRKFQPAPGLSLQMLNSARIGPNVKPLKDEIVGDIGRTLWLVMATVGIVLLIACANVANLLLVRAEGRQQELAIRAALGAGWSQIARHLLFESVTLAVLGGAVGLGLAYAALRGLIAIAPANLPRLSQISIDWHVLLFTLVVSLIAGLIFGLIPVLKYAGSQLATGLREGGRTLSESRERKRARRVLVVVQVGLAFVLLIGSGLMIRTLQSLHQVQPGFTRPDQILSLRISIPEAQVKDAERVARMYSDMVQSVAAMPGVTSVGLTNSITMDGRNDNDPIFAADRPTAEGKLPPLRRFKFIAPGYFKTMGNPLLAGRDLTWTDIYQKRNVVLISENFAREYWGNPVSALGKRIRESPNSPWREIIGVVGNERDDGVDKKAPGIVYWPMLRTQFWGDAIGLNRTLAFAIRSPRTGSSGFLKQVQKAIWSVNPEVPIADVHTVQEIYDKSLARTSFTLIMLAIAGAMALLLGIVGIYGVLSYSVAQRTREIGIRIALGATHGAVRRMFVGEGLILAAIGIAFGLAAAFALTRLMAVLLFGVSPLDPITYCIVPLVLGTAAWIASYLPARRATVVDPVEALRVE
ncbi:MAG TPA: ABC transporter permease [Bryobacteraceae bacterium]|nr:ABC transporter permease [Bryobacteraceae bacterium]